jgi:hypothetical protein
MEAVEDEELGRGLAPAAARDHRPAHVDHVDPRVSGRALADHGLLLLEPHTLAAVQDIGRQPQSWDTYESGLFSDKPHVLLQENSWDATEAVATKRFFVIDAASGQVTRYAVSYQAYTEQQYESLIVEHGFRDVQFLPSLLGVRDDSQPGLMSILASKA